jgi:phosphoglycolate phosphatase-like HAD superfamily hydrolase
MKPQKLIVFDMDGVLINVSGSYRETVRKSARLFFSGAKGFDRLPDPLFPLTDLAELKQSGGLNNDWDLTALVLHLLFAKVETPDGSPPWNGSSSWEETLKGCDLSQLADFLKDNPRPLMDLQNLYGRRREPLVSACYQGDVLTGNVIKRIFQEIYLGSRLFTELYGTAPRFDMGEGLILQESLLIPPALLESLSRNHILAIATGRPRAEADFALDRFCIRRYFRMILTLDDCEQEEERIYREGGKRLSLGKPDPYMLDLIPVRIGKPFDGCLYLGDLPDDMHAARSSRAGYRGIGVIAASADPEKLRRELSSAGAERIIGDFAELPGIIG